MLCKLQIFTSLPLKIRNFALSDTRNPAEITPILRHMNPQTSPEVKTELQKTDKAAKGCGMVIFATIIIAIIYVVFQGINSDSAGDSSDEIQAAAFQIAKQEVKSQLNNPATADFSLMSVTREKFGDNTYRIKGTLTAENSFGVEQELRYTVTLTYFEGNPLDRSSWNITTCEVKENR